MQIRSLSLYKTGPDTLGVFIHLLQLNGNSRSAANRRSHSNQNSTNENTNQGSGIYFKYAMCLVNTDGEVVNKIGKGHTLPFFLSKFAHFGVCNANLWEILTKFFGKFTNFYV